MTGGEAERVQTGVRIDKRLVKVLKALAELQDTSLGELLEALASATLAGTPAFGGDFLARARELAVIYGWPWPVLDSQDRGGEP